MLYPDLVVHEIKALVARCALKDGSWEEHVRKGAHVIVKGDGGRLYYLWQINYACTWRISSHHLFEAALQYQIGPVLVEDAWGYLLFGLCGGDTWFQFERHPADSDPARHLADFAVGLWKREQHGPGLHVSNRTDRRPVTLTSPSAR